MHESPGNFLVFIVYLKYNTRVSVLYIILNFADYTASESVRNKIEQVD